MVFKFRTLGDRWLLVFRHWKFKIEMFFPILHMNKLSL